MVETEKEKPKVGGGKGPDLTRGKPENCRRGGDEDEGGPGANPDSIHLICAVGEEGGSMTDFPCNWSGVELQPMS